MRLRKQCRFVCGIVVPIPYIAGTSISEYVFETGAFVYIYECSSRPMETTDKIKSYIHKRMSGAYKRFLSLSSCAVLAD